MSRQIKRVVSSAASERKSSLLKKQVPLRRILASALLFAVVIPISEKFARKYLQRSYEKINAKRVLRYRQGFFAYYKVF